MLTGTDVLKDYDKRIDLSSFKRREEIKEDVGFERTVRDILRIKNIRTSECFLNTTTKRSHLDICKEIIDCDYVWFNKDGEVIAFWEQKTKTLYY